MRRIIAFMVVFVAVNLLGWELTIQPAVRVGVLAASQEAALVYGGCMLPAYGSRAVCGYPHFFGGAGWDVADNYQGGQGVKEEEAECTCSGTYSTFGEELCFGGG